MSKRKNVNIDLTWHYLLVKEVILQEVLTNTRLNLDDVFLQTI